MEKHNSLIFFSLLLSLLFIISIIFITIFINHNSFVEGTSFISQEIIDNRSDWTNSFLKSTKDHPLTDILLVSFFSDGSMVNSTFWIQDTLFEHEHDKRPISKSNITFGMLIDVDSNRKTGIEGIDYNIAVNRENLHNNKNNNTSSQVWTKIVEQWSSTIPTVTKMDKRVVKEVDYQPKYGKRYIHLSFDLKAIGNPDQYRALFYTIEKKGKGSLWIMDFTKWINIPLPDINIATEPKNLEMVAGENKTIELRIESTIGFKPEVYLFTLNLPNGVITKFGSNNLTVPTYGMATTPMWITFPADAEPRQYVLTILTNSTISNEYIENVESDNSSNFIIPSLQKENVDNLTSVSSIAINVLAPLTSGEKFIKIITEWQWIIAIGIGIIVDRFIPWKKVTKGFSKFINKK